MITSSRNRLVDDRAHRKSTDAPLPPRIETGQCSTELWGINSHIDHESWGADACLQSFHSKIEPSKLAMSLVAMSLAEDGCFQS